MREWLGNEGSLAQLDINYDVHIARRFSSDPTKNRWSQFMRKVKILDSGNERWTGEIWCANIESLDSSKSQRGHFEFSWVGVTRILRITVSDLAP